MKSRAKAEEKPAQLPVLDLWNWHALQRLNCSAPP